MAADRLISSKQVAETLGVKRQTVLKWAREGKIAHYRVGVKRVLVPEREVQRILLQGYVPVGAMREESKSAVPGATAVNLSNGTDGCEAQATHLNGLPAAKRESSRE